MYRIFLTNHDRFTEGEYASIETVKRAVARIGFECTIYRATQIVASWSPIGGWKFW